MSNNFLKEGFKCGFSYHTSEITLIPTVEIGRIKIIDYIDNQKHTHNIYKMSFSFLVGHFNMSYCKKLK